MIERIPIPSSIDRTPLPTEIKHWISDARQRIEAFQDCWDKTRIEQFVAADYELVYRSLAWILETQPTIGRRFVEWGCGFAIVAALASSLKLDSIGIESEPELLAQGQRTIDQWCVPAELIHGNFLPRGCETLADDPTLPSLGHEVACGYSQIDCELDDFALVYSYPWPGEDIFHQEVFSRYGAVGAIQLMFCGPNDIRAFRKAR